MNQKRSQEETKITGKFRWNRIIATGALSIAAIFGAGWGIGSITDSPDQEELEAFHAATDLPSVGRADFQTPDGGWTEFDVMNTIHYMSHQKVEASQKWGALRITKENVLLLDQVIEEHKEDLIAYSVYRDILDRWIAGDFSQAVDDHNDIWEMQDGSIGKATGLMDPEEEKEYIDIHFSNYRK